MCWVRKILTLIDDVNKILLLGNFWSLKAEEYRRNMNRENIKILNQLILKIPYLSFSEDLVLAEERTTEKDRKRIMEARRIAGMVNYITFQSVR